MTNQIQADIVLLYANQYDMTDEQTGERTRGTSLSYYFNTGFEPIHNSDGSKGLRPAKSSSDWMLMTKINAAPALYKATFEMSIGSTMKPVLKIVDLDFVSNIEVISSL